jgi:DNA-binding NarL/FixJ family response regulator
MSQYAKRTDRNHAEIRRTLKQCGYYVMDTFRVGHGFPDLLAVSKAGLPVLLEVKMPGEKLTDAEREFWRSYPGPIAVVQSAQEAVDLMSDCDTGRVDWSAYYQAKRGDL